MVFLVSYKQNSSQNRTVANRMFAISIKYLSCSDLILQPADGDRTNSLKRPDLFSLELTPALAEWLYQLGRTFLQQSSSGLRVLWLVEVHWMEIVDHHCILHTPTTQTISWYLLGSVWKKEHKLKTTSMERMVLTVQLPIHTSWLNVSSTLTCTCM